jgi:hypothetical protein
MLGYGTINTRWYDLRVICCYQRPASVTWQRRLWRQATIGELLKAVFSIGSAPRLYNEDEFRVVLTLVRGGARYRQNSNFQTVINIWSWAPYGARNQDALTDWSSVVMWLWLWVVLTDWSSVVTWLWLWVESSSWVGVVWSCEPVKGGSGTPGRKSWALARRPLAGQYSLKSAGG